VKVKEMKLHYNNKHLMKRDTEKCLHSFNKSGKCTNCGYLFESENEDKYIPKGHTMDKQYIPNFTGGKAIRTQPHPLINPESKHYSMFDGVEAITRMEQLFTTEELMTWAKLTSFKYRLRVGKKEQVDSQSDIKKIITYENYYKYLENKQNADS
jgi:hypothetical protein